MICVMFLLINTFLPGTFIQGEQLFTKMGVFYATIIGLAAGLGLGIITEYYTGTGTSPVKSIAQQSITGSATNIISGLSVGMQSTSLPTIIIASAIIGAYHFAGYMV